METLNAEVTQVEVVSTIAHDEPLLHLNDLQLALVGGGVGIVVVQ